MVAGGHRSMRAKHDARLRGHVEGGRVVLDHNSP
jgi:hypothetical protein